MESKNVKYAMDFLKLAEKEMLAAENELKIGNYHLSVYHSQQTSEKSIKAILFLLGYRVYDHKVASEFISNVLSFEIGKWHEKLSKIAPKILELEEHWLRSRYPLEYEDKIISPLEIYKKEDAEKYLEYAREILNTIKEYLKDKFGIEVV